MPRLSCHLDIYAHSLLYFKFQSFILIVRGREVGREDVYSGCWFLGRKRTQSPYYTCVLRYRTQSGPNRFSIASHN